MIDVELGSYRVVRQIGAGGMGTVYAAEDLTLDRMVALKVLPPEMASDPVRRARFDREAKAIAALEHPNIVTIHAFEHGAGPAGDVSFITMQLIDGCSLGDVVPAGGLSAERFFELAVPIVDAVAFAHERGITHRDLKPANIMVGTDGRPMVLDFGLAKAIAPATAGAADATAAATHQAELVAGELTGEGNVLGTVSYMSPEQAEGKSVDHRSDIFSLGIILYRMATGEAPFRGDSALSIMSSIVRDTPPTVTDLNANVPRHLARIIRKCLEKDVTRRYQSARDLRNDLDDLSREYASGEVLPVAAIDPGAAPAPSIWPKVAALAGLVSIVMLVAWWLEGIPGVGSSPEFANWQTRQLTTLVGVQTDPSLSPDGSQFLYVDRSSGNADIYLQLVEGTRTVPLTERSTADDYQPAYSPDGERIAFRTDRDGGGIYVMGAFGEDQTPVVPEGYMPSWSPDGRALVYATRSFARASEVTTTLDLEIKIVDLDTRQPRSLGVAGLQPSWSPDGRRIVYFAIRNGYARDLASISVAREDSDWVVGEPVWITDDPDLDWSPRWSPDGRFLYFASNRGGAHNIWRVPIDQDTGQPTGAPQAVTRGGTDIQGFFSFSNDGRAIAYAARRDEVDILRIDVDPETWIATGDPTPITNDTRGLYDVDISPEGDWLVTASRTPVEDIFIMRVDGTDPRRLTEDPFMDRRPRWGPDGLVYFYSNLDGFFRIWSIDPAGGLPVLVTDAGDGLTFPEPSPDGTKMLIVMPGAGVGGQVFDLTRPYSEQTGIDVPRHDDGAIFTPVSWSPDSQRILGLLTGAGGPRRFGVLTLATDRIQLIDPGGPEVRGWIWLDERRMMARTWLRDRIVVYDTESGNWHDVLREPLAGTLNTPVPHPNGDALFVPRRQTSSDIHLLEIDGGGGS